MSLAKFYMNYNKQEPVYVNPAMVTHFFAMKPNESTMVYFINADSIEVFEEADAVARKLEEAASDA